MNCASDFLTSFILSASWIVIKVLHLSTSKVLFMYDHVDNDFELLQTFELA